MATKYDVIIIGGGHNGLTAAAYLAKAGKKVLVLERRHVLGGAAVTEEVFPGFKFSVCSYVVSLLRPEIIRDLDLPRHGLEILPLDGTFTPLDGDYLWRMNDHARTRREIYRWSPIDAEAYDEYSKSMAEMAHFVKPILSMIPPDPMGFDIPGFLKLAGLGKRFTQLSRANQHNLVQLMTMSAADMLDQWFETDPLKATMSASGIIGTFLGVRSPGTAYVLLHHYMGEIDGAFRSWGFSRGGTGPISLSIAGAAAEAGVEIRTKAGISRIKVKNGRATGVALENGDEIDADVVVSSVDPNRTFLKLIEPGAVDESFLDPGAALQAARLLGQGEPRARRPARLQVPAGRRRAPARRDVDLAQRRVHGEGLRRRQVRRLREEPVHGHGDPVADRPVGRAARAST